MNQYDNTDTGALFQNDRKENDKQPDYTGKINVQGIDFRLAGWKRQSNAGKPYLSLKVSEFQEKQDAPKHGINPQAGPPEGIDDEVPF